MRRRVLVVAILALVAAVVPVARASDATFHGSLGATRLNQPIVGMAATPSGGGYWLVAADGGVFRYGDAGFWGSAAHQRHARTVALVPTSTGDGYWLVDEDGSIWSFGHAPGVVGPAGLRITSAARATDRGLWLVTASGVVAPAGDAPAIGDLRSTHLNRPVVSIASTPTRRGYWLVATDGGIFSFGDAAFYGSTGAVRLNQPIVGMASSPGTGYWFVASDGGIFTFSPTSTPASSSTCTVFPSDNPWNTDVSRGPLDLRSAAWVASIGSGNLHPDFGTAYGIPYVEVPAGQRGVHVTFDDDDESDHALYPIPPGAPVENGSDAHVLVLSRSECRLYELFAASRQPDGSWHAGSGAIFDLRSNALRPDGWTSADAAGLPILPGLVCYDEVAAGAIDHALRFTVPRTQRGYIHPATHFASSITDPDVPPMGARFRMKSSYSCAAYSREVQVICTAMKRYGMFVADNGSSWYVTGAPDRRWDDAALDDMKRIPGSAFEAVDTGPVHTG
jgi:hypothetical protein